MTSRLALWVSNRAWGALSVCAALVACGALVSCASPAPAREGAASDVKIDVPPFEPGVPSALFRDADDAARARMFGDLRNPDEMARAERALARGVALEDHTSRGHQFAVRKLADDAAREYAVAFGLARQNPRALRHVRWGYGWSLFALGEPRAALAQWQDARKLHGGAPFWYPYTVAVGLWMAGEPDQALDWYDVAVASLPAWGTDRGVAQRTQHWQAHERRVIQLMFEAWRLTRRAPAAAAGGTR